MKDQEARVTCSNQKCQTCKGCTFANYSHAYEWEMDLTLVDLGHDTTSQVNERIHLDTAIEAATLAG